MNRIRGTEAGAGYRCRVSASSHLVNESHAGKRDAAAATVIGWMEHVLSLFLNQRVSALATLTPQKPTTNLILLKSLYFTTFTLFFFDRDCCYNEHI